MGLKKKGNWLGSANDTCMEELGWSAKISKNMKNKDDSMDHQEQQLYEQAAQLRSMEEYNLWEHRFGDYLDSLEERSQIKRLRLSIGEKQSLIARIARLESLKDSTRNRFVHAGAGHSARLRWREIDTAFVNRILTGVVINSNHIEPRNFLEDARDIVVDHVRNILLKHDSVKINTILNGEFVVGNKCANKSVNTKNCELFRLSDLREWYDLRVIEPILASLDEFQERDSGWALSRILNLIVNVNKYMPMHAGCVIQLPREIRLKKAVINVCSTDNACFAWSVVAALYPAESHVSLASSYPHYTTVLNIQDIEFPMTLNQIKKFEHMNNISINVYTIENKKVLPIRVTDKKMERHVNLLYLEGANDVGHFTWIKNLSRLVCTQLSKHNGRKYFCDRTLGSGGATRGDPIRTWPGVKTEYSSRQSDVLPRGLELRHASTRQSSVASSSKVRVWDPIVRSR
ncbi:uncharacterized protein LOC143350226 [Colletes latitarsis]|uniref:uncharacterized protein LOC143350226 n=1 Tax=Colletes latitarsis TaxID=2605962 RepID=UPI0040373123